MLVLYGQHIFSSYYAFEMTNSEMILLDKLAFLIKNFYHLFFTYLKTFFPLVILTLFGIPLGMLKKQQAQFIALFHL